MSKFLTSLPLCAALALMAPVGAYAQTDTSSSEEASPSDAEVSTTEDNGTTEDSSTTEDSGTTEDSSTTGNTGASADEVENQLSLGEDADKDLQLGKPYTKEEIGAWEMRCIKTEEEVDPCQMYQLLDDGEGNPVAEFSLFRLPGSGKAEAGATIVVPLETALPQQLTVSVDGGKARRYPYAFCNPVGCYVRLGLTKEDVAVFKRGKKAMITIVPALAPDQKVELGLSLDGFTASYDKVSVIQQ